MVNMFKIYLKTYLEAPPLPDDWNKDEFKRKNESGKKISFTSILKYAKSKAKKLGQGSSRVAFIIPYQGRETVLKIAKNIKGEEQNAVEADYGMHRMYGDSETGILIPLIDYDEDNEMPLWLNFEKADKITESQFKSWLNTEITIDQMKNGVLQKDQKIKIGFVEFSMMLVNQFDRQIRGVGDRSLSPNAIRMFDALDQESNAYKLISEVVDFCGNFDIIPGDFTTIKNWGMWKERPVIIDMGFSSKVKDIYFNARKLF